MKSKNCFTKIGIFILWFLGVEMRIKVNDVNHEFKEKSLSIRQILEKLNFTFPIIIVKHKETIVKESEFESYFIEDNDEITITHIFAGG